MKKFVFAFLSFSFLLVSCQDPSSKLYATHKASSKVEKEKKETHSRRW